MIHQITLAPDFCLLVQFFAHPAIQPEQHLLCALVDDAIQSLKFAHKVCSFKARRLAYEDSLWLTSECTSPGSFLWCCSLLDIDPDRLRAAITPLLVLEPPQMTRCGSHILRPLAYQAVIPDVHAIDRTGYFLILQTGKLRTQIALVSIHSESEVHAPGDIGRLICTRQSARKAGLLPYPHKPQKTKRTAL